MPFLDRELSEALSESLRRSGARLILGEAVESIGRDAQGLVVRVAGEELRPQIVLHAAGRTGNVEGLALADAGVELGRTRTHHASARTSRPPLLASTPPAT